MENRANFPPLYTVLFKNVYDQGEYQSKWLSCISDNLNGMGLGYLWNSQEFSTNWFKHTISQISKDTSVQNLRSDITESDHCQTYRTLKCNMEFEPYLTLLEKKYAIPLCKFCAGNSPLSVAAIKTPLEMNAFVFYDLIENSGMNTIKFLKARTSTKKDHS